MSVGAVDRERQRRDELACRFAEYINPIENLGGVTPEVWNFFYMLRDLGVVPKNFNESPDLAQLFVQFLITLHKKKQIKKITIQDEKFYTILAEGLDKVANS